MWKSHGERGDRLPAKIQADGSAAIGADAGRIPEPANEEVAKVPKQELMRMVGELPETKRVIFNLFCVEGYSHKDIAEMLNIKEKTSSSLLFKARAQLAENVKDYIRRNGL